jgi:hypothetical protein
LRQRLPMTPKALRFQAVALLASLVLFHPLAAHATTVTVKAGDDLQAAIDSAQPGDTLLLAAGATFTGNFFLPVKAGASFITIRSSASDSALPGPSTRMTPAYSALLPKLVSPDTTPALIFAPGAHHWRLMFLEFPATRSGYGEILRIGDGSSAQYTLSMVPHDITLDRVYIHGDPQLGQKRGIALNARSVTIRNSYISDIKAVGFDTQAIGGWNGPGPYVIENNYLEASGENFLLGGADPSIPDLVAENVVVRYNHFTRPMAWKDPILSAPSSVTATAAAGGSLGNGTYSYAVVAQRTVGSDSLARSAASAVATAATASGAVRISWNPVAGASEYRVYGRTAGGLTRYWTVTGTSFTDTGTAGQAGSLPAGPGDQWLVKNLFELKSARNVVVEYNVFENNWEHGQVGYAILLTPRNQDGGCPWCAVEQVTFQHNIVRNVAGGINVSGYDSPNSSLQTRDITIRNNLFYKLTTSLGGTGWFMLVGDEPRGLVVDHNTVDSDGSAVLYAYDGRSSTPAKIVGFQFTNNAARHNDYGISGGSAASGFSALSMYFTDSVVAGNWLQGGPASSYPSGNLFTGAFDAAFVEPARGNYRPAAGSILLGNAADGTNIGADVAEILRQTAAVTGGSLLARPSNLRIVK